MKTKSEPSVCVRSSDNVSVVGLYQKKNHDASQAALTPDRLASFLINEGNDGQSDFGSLSNAWGGDLDLSRFEIDSKLWGDPETDD